VGGDRDDLFVEEGAELFGERLVDEELDVVEVDVARVGDGQPLPRMW
jgi:hypothetical protein